MPIARRKSSPSRPRVDPSESESDVSYRNDGLRALEKLKPIAKPKESGWPKMKKRLTFGSLLLAFLMLIIAAGHMWTLVLVRAPQLASVPDATLSAPSHRVTGPLC